MKRDFNFRFWTGKEMIDWVCVCQTAFNCFNVIHEYNLIKKEVEEKDKLSQTFSGMLSTGEYMRKGLMYNLFTNCDMVCMQYIGVNDKTGREIYEGDILQLVDDAGNEIIVTCKWGIHERIMDSGYKVQIPSFAFVTSSGKPTFPILHNYAGKSDLDIMEVIGNIYQNPDLLTSL